MVSKTLNALSPQGVVLDVCICVTLSFRCNDLTFHKFERSFPVWQAGSLDRSICDGRAQRGRAVYGDGHL